MQRYGNWVSKILCSSGPPLLRSLTEGEKLRASFRHPSLRPVSLLLSSMC